MKLLPRSACPTAFQLVFIVALMAAFHPAIAGAKEVESEPAAKPASLFGEAVAAVVGGKPIVDVNMRWDYAKQDQQQHSHGATLRARLGYQTDAFRGFSALAEMVNTVSPKPSAYFDGVETNNGPQTIVADPERTDFNRGWLQFARKDWAGLQVKGGRQRIKLDDDRWIGNVGWRQNEQTFDAARVQTTLGLEQLVAQYIYAWQVNRIFADQGPEGRRDFGPRGHFINIAYTQSKALKAVGFAYLIDPNRSNFRAFGSQTYGARLTGAIPIDERFSLPYQASYAWQADWGNNQTSYDAHYYYVEGGVKVDEWLTVTAGYEVLGSDTDARVVTPFSTAHKFNGFADAFLNNGGNRGLRDFFATLAPAIPITGLTFKFFFHQFWDDQGGDDLGQEYDFVSTYKLNEYISFLYKFAYFDGGNKPAFSKTTRSTVDVTLKF